MTQEVRKNVGFFPDRQSAKVNNSEELNKSKHSYTDLKNVFDSSVSDAKRMLAVHADRSSSSVPYIVGMDDAVKCAVDGVEHMSSASNSVLSSYSGAFSHSASEDTASKNTISSPGTNYGSK